MIKKSGFTLAETLIVIGIIGVVAALTLPNLNSSTGDIEKVVKVRKIYSNLNDVFGRATVAYGPVNGWFVNDSNATAFATRFGERITEFMKLSKNCGISTNAGCFTSGASKTPDGSSHNFDTVPYFYKMITADGSSIAFWVHDKNFSQTRCCGYIYVDIDGPNKGSYTWGKDIFVFYIYKDRIVPNWPNNTLKDCIRYGSYCANWIIENGNMDYLKVDSDGKCPDGKTILDGTTNTTCK